MLAFFEVFYRGSVGGTLPGSGVCEECESRYIGMKVAVATIRIRVKWGTG